MRRIDADKIIRECDEMIKRSNAPDGNAFTKLMCEYLKRYIGNQDTVGPVMHDLVKNPEDLPKNEQWILMKVRCSDSDHVPVIGFHEDGTMNAEDSEYDWTEVMPYLHFDPVKHTHNVPEGWYEWSAYAGACSIGIIGDSVEAWCDIPEVDA